MCSVLIYEEQVFLSPAGSLLQPSGGATFMMSAYPVSLAVLLHRTLQAGANSPGTAPPGCKTQAGACAQPELLDAAWPMCSPQSPLAALA